MKKTVIFAAIAALALASCAKNEVIQNEADKTPVTFGVYAGQSATKATYGDITTDNLKTSTDGFGVFAYYTQTSAWSTSGFTPNFMHNQKVQYNGSANTNLYPNKWEYSPLKYWPNGQNSTAVDNTTHADKLSFFAYAPYAIVNHATGATESATAYPSAGEGVTAVSTNTATGAPTVTFTVPAKSDEQIDLLWANPVKDQTKQLMANEISFTFNHALSKLQYQVQAVVDAAAPTTANLDADTKIILESLQVTVNGTKTGTLNLNDGTWSSVSGNSVVTYDNTNGFSSNTTVNGKTGFSVTETATVLNAANSPMIIPANLAIGDLKVEANYWVITEDDQLAGGFSTIQNDIYSTNDAVINLVAGKSYTIVVRLGLNSVDFEVAEVTAWDPVAGTPVDLPLNL